MTLFGFVVGTGVVGVTYAAGVYFSYRRREIFPLLPGATLLAAWCVLVGGHLLFPEASGQPGGSALIPLAVGVFWILEFVLLFGTHRIVRRFYPREVLTAQPR